MLHFLGIVSEETGSQGKGACSKPHRHRRKWFIRMESQNLLFSLLHQPLPLNASVCVCVCGCVGVCVGARMRTTVL